MDISYNTTEHLENTTTSSIPRDAMCRICRGSHNKDKPLYHPCVCSGSIKYIHEECLSEWLQHSGQNKCEVCHFEYQYNLDWGSREKNAKMMNVVRKRDFVYYLMKKLLHSTIGSLRVLFVSILWFHVFILNTLLISPFLPSQLMDKLFPKTNTQSNDSTFLTNNIFIDDGDLSFYSIFISITFGGFAQIMLFIALCIFEFHHRHRDGVVADFGFAFAEEVAPIAQQQHQQHQPQEEEKEAVPDVLPPDEDGGLLNPDNIRDARPIELLGLRGRLNAFFSTIISVTVFNVALISTLFWLPTIVGHCMILFRRHLYTLSMLLLDAVFWVYNNLGVINAFGVMNEWLDLSIIHILFDKIILNKVFVLEYVLSHPMLFGYIVLSVVYSMGLCLDLMYYYLMRPYLVKQRKELVEIHSFWILCEELSRIHTVFWRLIDSVLRVWDFVFQLLIVPYTFGRGIALATECIRIKSAHPSFMYLFDNIKNDDKLLHILESSLLEEMSYWMVGFWYIYGSMKMFGVARELMRIEFNAYWMRFPQPNQIPISLSIVRAMKERIISMRIHIPLILLGIHIPCKLMLKLFPKVFPINVYALEIHKWPTAGILFMISCILAVILKRIRVQRRWHRFARYWLDTVCFALNIGYLIVADSNPPDNYVPIDVIDVNDGEQEIEDVLENEERVSRRDDVFLLVHPSQNINDVYLRLQNERNKYIERCRLYTIGIDHLRLRIFVFIMFLWVTHIILFCILFLVPLVCGRVVFNEYFDSLSYIKNKDILSYIFGLFFCVIIPNEIHFILSYHFEGTLLNNIQKCIIRGFIFIFIPLYLGYGWNSMIYHALHSISLTPIHCVLELFCTGIYIAIIFLLFQNHNDLENVLIWIQNNNNVNLYRFWKEFAFPCLKLLIYHISLPIAARYWLMYYINNKQSTILHNQTVIIDLNAINSDLDLIQKSVLKLQSILLNKVFLHYNSYELYLFLSCDVWKNLYQFIFIECNWNILTFLYEPFIFKSNNLIVTNIYVIYRFFKFMMELLILKCPIPLFGAVKLLLYLIHIILNHIPKIKNIILQEKYFANRRLINFEQNPNQNPVT